MAEYFLAKHRPGLFRSAAWLEAWNLTWGKSPSINSVGSSGENLSAAICTYRQKIKKIISFTTAFPLGVSTPATQSLRSEYFMLADAGEDPSRSVATYVDSVATFSWSQFYIPDVLEGSIEWAGFARAAQKNKWVLIVKEVSRVYGVDVSTGGFLEYLENLGANTRLKLFNRRKNLESLGAICVKNIWPDKSLFFSLINSFHEVRWGRACYSGKNADFISLVLDKLNEAGHTIDLSVMMLDDRPISVILDIGINGRVYNLQSGYVEQFSKNISIGTLHFGYQIEKAFLNDDVDFYDFMAGNGKNANYKESLANSTATFNTLLLVRNPILKLFYRLQKLL